MDFSPFMQGVMQGVIGNTIFKGIEIFISRKLFTEELETQFKNCVQSAIDILSGEYPISKTINGLTFWDYVSTEVNNVLSTRDISEEEIKVVFRKTIINSLKDNIINDDDIKKICNEYFYLIKMHIIVCPPLNNLLVLSYYEDFKNDMFNIDVKLEEMKVILLEEIKVLLEKLTSKVNISDDEKDKKTSDIKEIIFENSRNKLNGLLGGDRIFYYPLEEDILCNVKVKNLYREDNEEYTVGQAIDDLWRGRKNAYLTGDGGMGKSTSLRKLWDSLLDKKVLPFYIKLNDYKSEADFIAREIRKDYLCELDKYGIDLDIDNNKKHLLIRIVDSLESNSIEINKPIIILLLDGLNEIAMNYESLKNELKQIITGSRERIQILITTRIYPNNFLTTSFEEIELQGLSDMQIERYLQNKSIKQKVSNTLLRNPMMIYLYTEIEKHIKDEYRSARLIVPIESNGALMWNYMEAQRVNNIAFKDRYNLNEAEINFIFKHLIPYVGHKSMVTITGFFGYKLLELIENYINEFEKDYRLSFDYYYEKLNALCSEKWNDLIKFITDNKLMIKDNENYVFSHLNFRDFYAACNLMNEVYYSHKYKSLRLNEMLNKEISSNVRKYAGQCIEGRINKKKETVFNKLLDDCREIFDGSVKKTIFNVIDTWKSISDGSLTECNCVRLDLTEVNFDGINLSNVCFDGAKINDINFIPQGHTAAVINLEYSPCGKKILSCSEDNTIKEFVRETGRCLTTYKGHSRCVKKATYINAGENILSVSYDGTIRIWKVKNDQSTIMIDDNDEPIYMLDNEKEEISCMDKFNNEKIVFGTSNGCIHEVLFNESNYAIVHQSETSGHTGKIWGITYIKNGCSILSASEDGTVKEWRMNQKEKPELLLTYEYPKDLLPKTNDLEIEKQKKLNGFYAVAYNLNRKKIIAGTGYGNIIEWNVGDNTTYKIYREVNTNFASSVIKQYVRCLIFNDNGTKILSGGDDRKIKEWEVGKYDGHSNEYRREYDKTAHDSSVWSLVFSEDGHLLSGSYDKCIREWVVETRECLRTFLGKNNSVNSVTYSGDGKRILMGSNDKTIKLWEASTFFDNSEDYWFRKKFSKVYEGHHNSVRGVSFYNDSEIFVSSSDDCSVREWKVDELVESNYLKDFGNHQIKCMTCSNDRTIIYATDEGQVKAFNFECKENVKAFNFANENINCIPFNFSKINCMIYINKIDNGVINELIVTGHHDGTINVWNLFENKLITSIMAHKERVCCMAYHEKICRIISGSEDGIVKEWSIDLRGLNEKNAYHLGLKQVRSIAYCPDGLGFIVGFSSGHIELWKRDKEKEDAIYKVHNDSVEGISFNPKVTDNFVTASYEGQLKEWKLTEIEKLGENWDFILNDDSCNKYSFVYDNFPIHLFKNCSFENLHVGSDLKECRKIFKQYGIQCSIDNENI